LKNYTVHRASNCTDIVPDSPELKKDIKKAIKKSGEKRRNVGVFPGRRARKNLFWITWHRADSFFLMGGEYVQAHHVFIFRK
jgi:hypothetical protein